MMIPLRVGMIFGWALGVQDGWGFLNPKGLFLVFFYRFVIHFAFPLYGYFVDCED
nr:MAG TPA: hypothetical protein [Caudoviricetes sp.]